ncbi:MAG: DUF6455 family protein [Methyloceanibacter sp.]
MVTKVTKSRSWPMLARALRRHELMDEMMEKQGVAVIAAVRAGDAFVEARANCRDCACETACRNWFLEESEDPAEFCPNLDFFTTLKREGA